MDQAEPHDPTGLELASEIAQATVEAAEYVGVALPEPPRAPRKQARSREPSRSGAHPDDRDPQLVGSVLENVIVQRGWKLRIGLSTLLQRWPELVGATNAEHSKPRFFDDGVLTVECDSTAWAAAMRYSASQLVAKLNRELGQQSVRRVEFRGPKAPNWKHGPRSVPGQGPRDTYG